MQKILVLVLLLVAVIFQYELWYGRGGIYDAKSLEKGITRQQSTNQQLQQRNDIVIDHLQELKGSVELMQARARKELDLIKPDEMLVLFPESVGKSTVNYRNN